MTQRRATSNRNAPPLDLTTPVIEPASVRNNVSHLDGMHSPVHEQERQLEIKRTYSITDGHIDQQQSEAATQFKVIKKIGDGTGLSNSSFSVKQSHLSGGRGNQFSEYDHVYKIILIGSSFTGKTSLLIRFVTGGFSQNYLNTVGVDLKSVTLKIHDTLVRVNIWDTTGQEKFKSLTKSYYRSCQGAIAIFDITKKESFTSIQQSIKEFQQNCPEAAASNIILVGNKADLEEERQVGQMEAEMFCSKLNLIKYYETSAQTNMNVDNAFFEAAHKAYEDELAALEKKNQESIHAVSAGSTNQNEMLHNQHKNRSKSQRRRNGCRC